MITKALSSKLVLLVIGLAAGSGILIPAGYASFHPVTSSEIQNETILSVDIKNGEVKTDDIAVAAIGSLRIKDNDVKAQDLAPDSVGASELANGAVNSAKIADGTIAYADLSRSFVRVEHRDDCNCGGTGWDPDGTSSIEKIYDDRITPHSVVAVTSIGYPFTCSTYIDSPTVSGFVYVKCTSTIPAGMGINYAIFNNL